MPKQPTKTSAQKTPKRSATPHSSTHKRQQANSVSKPQSRRLFTWILRWATMAVFAVVFILHGVVAPPFEHAVAAAGTTSPIVSAIGNKCLDTSWGKALSTARLEPCFNNSPQQWALPGDGTIRNNTLCLDVKYAGTTRGTTVWLYRCNGTVAQQWKVTATGQIINPHSNLCLDDRHSSSVNGNPIWIWRCNGTNAQKWAVPRDTMVSPTPTPRAVSDPATDPSGIPAPVGNIPGWQQLFVDDFTSTVPLGAFSDCNHNTDTPQAYCNGLRPYGSYFNNWWAYPTGWPDTAKSGADGNTGAPFGGVYHPEDTVSVSNGAMHIRMYRPSTDGDNHSATVVPLACSNRQYGRYVERFKVVHADPGFKSAHLFYEGGYEIDFPENDYGQTISAYTHPGEANFSTNATWTSWHTSVIEWTSGSIKFYLDGRLIGTTSTQIPHIKMSWILQNESSILGPYATSGAYAQLDIDWVACYAPAP